MSFAGNQITVANKAGTNSRLKKIGNQKQSSSLYSGIKLGAGGITSKTESGKSAACLHLGIFLSDKGVIPKDAQMKFDEHLQQNKAIGSV